MSDGNPADEQLMRLAMGADDEAGDEQPQDAPKDDVAEPLELTEEVDPNVNDEADAEEAEEEGDDQPKKKRHRTPEQRIAEARWKQGEAERKAAALEARLAEIEGKKPSPDTEAPKRPDPDDFEFGEADPAYIDKLTDWKIETRDHERKQVEQTQSAQRELVETINSGVAKAETEAKAKYDDFDERIAEAVEARAGEPLPPLLTIGIGTSPVGGDVIYRLATDEGAAERLEKLAQGGAAQAQAFAMAIGEIEGEYMADGDDTDLDVSDPMEMARMMGRMRARLKGPKESPPEPRKVTRAPEPPEHRARGTGGKFEVSDDTEDFAAFERKIMGKR